MARRNILLKVKEGGELVKRTGCDLYADEAQTLHDLAAGSEFDLMQDAYRAGLAIGYQRRKYEEAKKRKAAKK